MHDDLLDATGTGNNGTNHGTTNTSPARIADGQNFTPPSDWIAINNHPNRTGSFSYSGWFKTNDISKKGQRIICDDETNTSGGYAVSVGDGNSTGKLRFFMRGLNPTSLDSPSLISNGTWYHFTATYNASSGVKKIFIDGNEVASHVTTGQLVAHSGTASIGGETDTSDESDRRFNGDLDEIRSFPGVLSADWIETEYNNQSNPSGFISVSTEYSVADLCMILPIELINFTVKNKDSRSVQINWSTASETNNSYFLVEKSKNGQQWIALDKIEGAGNSTHTLLYTAQDNFPYHGISYYRLKQVDFDGKFSHSKIESVEFSKEEDSEVRIFPNPSSNSINIVGSKDELENIQFSNLAGQILNKKIKIIKESAEHYSIDLSNLPSGFYLLQTKSNSHYVIKK